MKTKLLFTLLSVSLIAGCQTIHPPEPPIDYSKIKLAKGKVVNDGENTCQLGFATKIKSIKC
jgi:hypothetical protein